jgi:mRNA interferase MazF
MKKGDIILVPFYFTDFSNYKLRPSLIVSHGQSTPGDFIVAFIPTIIASNQTLHPTHFIIDVKSSYFATTGLKKTSILKRDKLMTINHSIIAGLLGELPGDIIKIIDQKLKKALLLQ